MSVMRIYSEALETWVAIIIEVHAGVAVAIWISPVTPV